MAVKTFFVEELVKAPKDTLFSSLFRLESVIHGTTKYGKPFMRFKLTDRTGSIVAKWWDCGQEAASQDLPSSFAVVSGRVDPREDGMEICLTAPPQWAPEPADTSDFDLLAPLALNILHDRLDVHIASIGSSHIRGLVETIFHERTFRKKFDNAPAAEKMHHVCRHGLLQHTVEVADLAAAVADVQRSWGYRPVNRDLAVAGALLHDIGKVDELERDTSGVYQVSRRGYFVGHIVSGMQRVNRAMNSIPDFPMDLKDVMLHLILSHHGKREWGSPMEPALPEAQIVHMADMVDVHLFYIQEASAASTEDFVKVWKLSNQRMYTKDFPDLDETGGGAADQPNIVRETEAARPYIEMNAVSISAEAASVYRRTPVPVFKYRTALSIADERLQFSTRRIPLVGRAAAGVPILAEEHIEEYYDVESIALPADVPFFLLRVSGESMSGDSIHDGDLVVVRKQETHDMGDIVVVYLRDREEAAIKRLSYRVDGDVVLESSNPAVSPIVLHDAHSVEVHGRVVGVLGN